MKTKLTKILTIVFAASMLLTGCNNSAESNNSIESNNKLTIVTSFYPMYISTLNIVKDNIKVEENQLEDLLNMGSSVDDKTLSSFSSLYSAVRALPIDEQSRMFDMVERGEFSISCR